MTAALSMSDVMTVTAVIGTMLGLAMAGRVAIPDSRSWHWAAAISTGLACSAVLLALPVPSPGSGQFDTALIGGLGAGVLLILCACPLAVSARNRNGFVLAVALAGAGLGIGAGQAVHAIGTSAAQPFGRTMIDMIGIAVPPALTGVVIAAVMRRLRSAPWWLAILLAAAVGLPCHGAFAWAAGRAHAYEALDWPVPVLRYAEAMIAADLLFASVAAWSLRSLTGHVSYPRDLLIAGRALGLALLLIGFERMRGSIDVDIDWLRLHGAILPIALGFALAVPRRETPIPARAEEQDLITFAGGRSWLLAWHRRHRRGDILALSLPALLFTPVWLVRNNLHGAVSLLLLSWLASAALGLPIAIASLIFAVASPFLALRRARRLLARMPDDDREEEARGPAIARLGRPSFPERVPGLLVVSLGILAIRAFGPNLQLSWALVWALLPTALAALMVAWRFARILPIGTAYGSMLAGFGLGIATIPPYLLILSDDWYLWGIGFAVTACLQVGFAITWLRQKGQAPGGQDPNGHSSRGQSWAQLLFLHVGFGMNFGQIALIQLINPSLQSAADNLNLYMPGNLVLNAIAGLLLARWQQRPWQAMARLSLVMMAASILWHILIDQPLSTGMSPDAAPVLWFGWGVLAIYAWWSLIRTVPHPRLAEQALLRLALCLLPALELAALLNGGFSSRRALATLFILPIAVGIAIAESWRRKQAPLSALAARSSE